MFRLSFPSAKEIDLARELQHRPQTLNLKMLENESCYFSFEGFEIGYFDCLELDSGYRGSSILGTIFLNNICSDLMSPR